ncbi:hypothetical protein [Desulfofalx alkaliphila]|uniref:hypothetical protein n=1 Tax=Desulfofalx alkaliphila TaxID=105483 RepID=UPI0004E1D907|nr:hypothetical protein [Desulfofalx alkaliphila]
MNGFWRGMVAGGIIAMAMSMYINPNHKKRNSIIGMGLGMRRKRKANRMLRGVSKTVRELVR